MTTDEKLKELDGLLAERLTGKGFRRIKKMFYTRKQGACDQSVILMPIKIRGRDQYTVDVYYGIVYEHVAKMVQYLQGRKSVPNERMAQNALTNLIKGPRPYVFYVDEQCNVEEIVTDILDKIDVFVEPIWRENVSLEEFVKHVENQPRVFGFPQIEWIRLSMALMKDSASYKEVIHQNQDLFNRPCNRAYMEGLESRIQKYLDGEVHL